MDNTTLYTQQQLASLENMLQNSTNKTKLNKLKNHIFELDTYYDSLENTILVRQHLSAILEIIENMEVKIILEEIEELAK